MNIRDEFDTIAAPATPMGTGGVGIIRISGDKAFEIAEKIFSNPKFEPGKFKHGWIKDGETKIDEVVILPFFAPNSYTSENVIEIQCHGGINIVKNILNIVLKNGARMAEKGEFTKRAFLNKRMDLSQAESVADIIHAKTSEFAKISMKNLSGVLKAKIDEIRNDIFEVLSKITAGIDFPEDVSEPEYSYLEKCFENIIKKIDSTLSGAQTSNIFREGAKVAIIGKPNVGKSSLFNALLSLDRAIVTDIAGTTRDILRETLDLGIPVTLTDTAGIREKGDVSRVEKIGIEYSKQTLDEADLVLFVYDASKGMDSEDREVLELLKDKNHIVLANKSDIADKKEDDAMYISASNGDGIEELRNLLKSKVCNIAPENLDFVTNTRQQLCLKKAKKCIEQALLAAQINELQDLISIDVKSAILALDELTGELVTDDVLNNIFENFCIGK